MGKVLKRAMWKRRGGTQTTTKASILTIQIKTIVIKAHMTSKAEHSTQLLSIMTPIRLVSLNPA